MFDRRPLILAYHAVHSTWPSALAVTEAGLTRQAAFLAERGYTGLTLTDAEERRQRGDLPERCVAFTFDDGYVSTQVAADVLDRFGFPGTVFAVIDYVDRPRPFAWFGIEGEEPLHLQPLGWDALRGLKARGWEIGSHTVTHPLLTAATADELAEELERSRARIVDELGGCDAIAYPYGQADTRVASAAAMAGYRVGVMLTGAVLADEPLRRPRVGLFTRDQGVRLRLKLSRPALAARRSGAAKGLRRLRRSRTWLPSGGE
jgi:peptidoglycan/xylan/chitin deacetylase (PgdA/CDA1 family)